MKHKNYFLRTCISFILVLCLTLGNIPFSAFAASERSSTGVRDVNNDGKISYVSFGESVTNGYGMEGYRYADGTNVFGFLREPDDCYPVLIREYLEDQGYTVDLKQMAVSAYRMDELHWLLCDCYEPDEYHHSRYDGWNASIVSRMLTQDDGRAYLSEYIAQYGSDSAVINNADSILSAEYRKAVEEADLITIDMGTNNFGTFMTSTIQYILGLSDIPVTVDFSVYVDENTAASLDAMMEQMAANMAGASDGQAYTLILTLGRCLLYGYLGFTHHYDAALDAIYELNPEVQIVVVDVYSMISGVDLEGEALGEGLDLDQLYGLFIDLANYYTRDLSPYAHKVTHANLDDNPELFVDYYKDYPNDAYPDNQYLHSSAERLMNEFIMEMMGYDPDYPEEREQFNEDVLSNIQLLDNYVNNLQDTVKTNIIDAIDAQVDQKLDSLAETVNSAITVVGTAQEAVEAAVEGVATTETVVDAAVEGVATAKEATKAAIDGTGLVQGMMDLLVEELIDHEVYGQLFEGSNTSEGFKSNIISNIKEYITDDVIAQAGFENTDENKSILAEEAYVMACVYEDTITAGGTREEANRLAVIEGVSYILTVNQGASEAEAEETASLSYDLYTVYVAEGETAAVKAAIETKVTDEMLAEYGLTGITKAEAATIIYALGTAERDTAIQTVLQFKTDATTAKQAIQLNNVYETEGNDAAVKAALMMQVDETEAEQALALNAYYQNLLAGGSDEDAALAGTIVFAMVNVGGYEQSLAEALYAIYTDSASDEQEHLAYVTLMVTANMGIDSDTAEAIYTCYVSDLDGQYNNDNVKATMTFFMVYTKAAADSVAAAELYDQYLLYKSMPATLSKIANCSTIYFDTLLAAADSGDVLGSVAEKFMNGTLKLDKPAEDASAEEWNTYKSDSTLSVMYLRFLAQDGVFTHPSEKGQQMLAETVKSVLGSLKTADADDGITLTSDTKITVLSDNIAASEGSYADLLNTQLGGSVTKLAYENFRINEVLALLDSTYAGDEYTETVLGSNKAALATAYQSAVSGSDVVIVNLGAMNMGFLAAQFDLYSQTGGSDTYSMEFSTVDSMNVFSTYDSSGNPISLGVNVDNLLESFGSGFQTSGVTSESLLMLSLETYGYGYTTFVDCIDDTIAAIKALNSNAHIVLVGQYDLVGGAIFYHEETGMYLEMGDFIGHALNLMNEHMETYAAMNAGVSYVDVTGTEKIGSSVDVNMAETDLAKALADAMPSDNGHASIAEKVTAHLNGLVEEESGQFELYGANMVLGNNLSMNFYIDSADLTDGESYYAVITKEYADGREDLKITISDTDWQDYNGKYYRVTLDQIAAKEMADEITVVIYNAKGEAVSTPWTDSVRAYTMRGISGELSKTGEERDEKLMSVYVEMLNYGAAAQKNFNYNIDDLANNELTEAHKEYSAGKVQMEDNRVSAGAFVGTSLTLESNIMMNFYFGTVPADYERLYAEVTYTDHYGKEKECKVNGEDFIKYNATTWGVTVDTLVVADCRQPVTVKVYDDSGEMLAFATDSVESYAARRGENDALSVAIMTFADAAYHKFH